MKFLDRAVQLAIDNVQDGGTPYGAVVVHDGVIIGEGVNTIHQEFDVSGHAELIAIRQAQKVLQSNDLSDCVIYASGHPCPMCFGAIGFVGISTVYYANTLEEAADVGMDLSLNIYNYLRDDKDAFDIQMIHTGEMEEDRNPMKLYSKHINENAHK